MAQAELPPVVPGQTPRVVTDPERRWIHALLVAGTLTVSLLLVGLVANILLYFSDILLVFFMAWLLAFALSPIVSAIIRAVPMLPRGLVTILTYLVIMVGLSVIVLLVANSLATSIGGFVANVPDLQARLPQILAPWQARVDQLGLSINLVASAQDALHNLSGLGGGLVKPLTDLSLAILGIFGNFLLIVFLSLFMVMDKDRMIAFANRLVPPRYSDEVRLFETSVASSFGGFIRGQLIQGLVYGAVAGLLHLVLGIDYGPASAALVGLLQAIPFFGPFLSWAPPIIAAVLTKPDAVIPAFIVMAIGWFVVMNVLQPRIMASAIGIHPIAVLGSVLIGLKLAGVAGAVFGLPIAAVLSSFFFHYLNRSSGGPRDMAHRAAKRVEQREGRRVRVPLAPHIGGIARSAASRVTGATTGRVEPPSTATAADTTRGDPVADLLSAPHYAIRDLPDDPRTTVPPPDGGGTVTPPARDGVERAAATADTGEPVS